MSALILSFHSMTLPGIGSKSIPGLSSSIKFNHGAGQRQYEGKESCPQTDVHNTLFPAGAKTILNYNISDPPLNAKQVRL